MTEKTVFTIEGKGLKLNSAEDVESFIKEIKDNEHLEEIRLCGNTWSAEACAAFAECLVNHKKLKTAILHDIFTGRLKEIVPPSLISFGKAFSDKNLVTLDLSDNAFGPSGAEALTNLLTTVRSLEYIRINNNGLGPQGGKIIGNALQVAQRHNEANNVESRLKTIIIGRNRLENGSMAELGTAFAMHANLEEVCLPQNGIRPDGIKVLLEHLRKCTKLQTLDLQDNTFTESGSFALKEALPSWPKLAKLNVGDCLLGEDGSLLVLKALGKLEIPLVYLNLQYNEINEDGALILAEMLEKYPNLISLFLNGNSFNPDGVAANALKSALERLQKDDILDSWSDMDFEEDEEDLSSEEEVEADSKLEKEDDLSQQLNSLKI